MGCQWWSPWLEFYLDVWCQLHIIPSTQPKHTPQTTAYWPAVTSSKHGSHHPLISTSFTPAAE